MAVAVSAGSETFLERMSRAALQRLGPTLAGGLLSVVAFFMSLFVVTFLGSHAEHDHTAAQFGLAALAICVVTGSVVVVETTESFSSRIF